MFKTIKLAILFYFLTSSVFANEVISVYATSSSSDSKNIICLFNNSCHGLWKPYVKDNGVNEGVYLQFSEWISANEVLVQVKGTSKNIPLVLYVNGIKIQKSQIKFEKGNSFFRFDLDGFYPRSVYLKYGTSLLNEKELPVTYELPTLLSVKFLNKDKKEVALRFPEIVSATITATSTLSPYGAYSPANLFDSKYDFAWSTNGKKTNGVNEQVDILFKSKVSIEGMMIWNGYQRSKAHFVKNSAARELDILVNGKIHETIQLADVNYMQGIVFKKPILKTTNISLKIKMVRPGKKYQDMLISELRFLGPNKTVILPQISKKKQKYSKSVESILDQSYSTFVQGIFDKAPGQGALEATAFCKEYGNSNIRIRSNGSFVIYTDHMSKKNDQHGDVVLSQHEVIMEGNWEPIGMGKIRVFGKKYQSSFVDNKTVWVSDYGKENDMTSRSDESESTKIFQSFLTFKPYSTLSKKERKAYIQELIKEKKSLKPNKFYIFHGLFKEKEILYTEKKQFKKHLDELLLKYDPVYIKSSVINNLLVPTQNVLMFNKSCL